jgi:hypothetical protein
MERTSPPTLSGAEVRMSRYSREDEPVGTLFSREGVHPPMPIRAGGDFLLAP